jgi:hypothetical protein
LQRLFGAVRTASKVPQPFNPLPLTHNHHACAKHALYGGFQQQIPHWVFHSVNRLAQLPANQSPDARFGKSACGYLALCFATTQQRPSRAFGVAGVNQF